MDRIVGVLRMVLPVLLMLCIGMLCRKKIVVQKQGIAGLKALVVNVCLPAVLLRAFSTATYSLGIIAIALSMFAICLLALGAGFVLSKAARAPRITPFLLTGFEAGMLGYALYTLMFGAKAVTDFATVDLGQVLFVFTVYLSLLRRGEPRGKGSLAASLKAMVTSPIIIAIAAGVAIGASGLGRMIEATAAGSVIAGTLDFIAAPTAAVILFVVGYDLTLKKQSLKAALSAVAARALLMALLCVAVLLSLGALLPISDTLRWAFILMFILPPPFVLPIFTTSGDETAYASAALSMHTVLTLVAFGVIAFFVA